MRQSRAAMFGWHLRGLGIALVVTMLAACAIGPTPAPSATASPTPMLESAASVLDRYERALVAGNWDAAWAMLAPEQQATWKFEQGFQDAVSAYLKLYGPGYIIRPEDRDPAHVRDAAREAGLTTVDPKLAVLVQIDRVPMRDNSAWEQFIVGLVDGTPRIWQLR